VAYPRAGEAGPPGQNGREVPSAASRPTPPRSTAGEPNRTPADRHQRTESNGWRMMNLRGAPPERRCQKEALSFALSSQWAPTRPRSAEEARVCPSASERPRTRSSRACRPASPGRPAGKSWCVGPRLQSSENARDGRRLLVPAEPPGVKRLQAIPSTGSCNGRCWPVEAAMKRLGCRPSGVETASGGPLA